MDHVPRGVVKTPTGASLLTCCRWSDIHSSTRNRFQAWSLGLERALSMLMGPGGAGPETPGSLLRDGGGSGGMIRTECAPRILCFRALQHLALSHAR